MLLETIKMPKIESKNYTEKHKKMDANLERIVKVGETYLGNKKDVVLFHAIPGYRVEYEFGHIDFLKADEVFEIYMKQKSR
jgi:hypothetical protein